MKVLFITNVPYPYTVDYLSELGKKCDLVALFERSTSSERDSSWANFKFNNCRATIMQGIKIGVESALCFEVIRHIKKEKADIVLISNPCTPTGILEQIYMRIHGISYCIQSEGAFVGKGWGLKERIKKFIMEKAKLYFSTGKCQDEYFLKYGAQKSQIKRFPFTSLKEDEIRTRQLTADEKQLLKKKLGIEEEIVIICVGRFVPGKGIDILLKALPKERNDIRTLIIGGKPTDEYRKICKERQLKQVTFINHISKSELKEYYACGNLFILPTYSDTWGLVIVEAMSNGLPVICTDKCVAACTLIKDGENGFVLPAGDILAFSEKISKVCNNKETLDEMGQNALQNMQHYSLEKMADCVFNGISEL